MRFKVKPPGSYKSHGLASVLKLGESFLEAYGVAVHGHIHEEKPLDKNLAALGCEARSMKPMLPHLLPNWSQQMMV